MHCTSLLVPEGVHEFIEHTKAQFPPPRKRGVVADVTFELRISLARKALDFTMRQLTRLVPRQSAALVRPFSTSRTLRLKEDKEQSPEEAEKAKQEAMKSNKGSREAATVSEEVVGADQEKVKDHDKHMEQLQKETAQKSEENHPKGKS